LFIFANLFKSKLDQKLEKLYVPILKLQLKLDEDKATKLFYELLSKIKKDLKKSKAKNIKNQGNTLLEKEELDKDIKKILDQKRKHGVTNSDIKRWWNLDNLERTLSMVFENYSKALLFTHLSQSQNLSKNEIENIISKTYPKYGDIDENVKDISGNDPLPYELKHRINLYTARKQKENPKYFHTELEKHSSFNAFVRKEIEGGRL